MRSSKTRDQSTLKVMMRTACMTRHLKTLQRISKKLLSLSKASAKSDWCLFKDEHPARYANAKLKAWILKCFGNSVRFAYQKHRNEPRVVYSSDVDIKELINFANECRKALDDDSLVKRDDNTMQEIV